MSTDTLIKNLQHPALYDHPIDTFNLVESHLSWVILTGKYAYKIKKPVNFGFVDFSSLEKRKYYCELEQQRNAPLAGQLYEAILPITGTETEPKIGDTGEAIEYMVKMHQFQQQEILSELHAQNKLTSTYVEDIADQVAAVHQTAATAASESTFGSYQDNKAFALENFTHSKELMDNQSLPNYFDALQDWTATSAEILEPTFMARKKQGFVKACHGDLHLGNIALYQKQPIIFDCIEFNESFYWIDVFNDAAFLIMDLCARDSKELAFTFLNRYLIHTGDYAGIKLLNFFVAYRAMVRAKVALLTNNAQSTALFQQYAALAHQFSQNPQPKIYMMHGLSGSGKSSIAKNLASQLPAICISSDVERKRIAKQLQVTDLYSQAMHEKTYTALHKYCQQVIEAGYSVILDATYIRSITRQTITKLAEQLQTPLTIIDCFASETELRKRIIERNDPHYSDATVEVLELLQQEQQPLTEIERTYTVSIDTQIMESDDIINAVVNSREKQILTYT